MEELKKRNDIFLHTKHTLYLQDLLGVSKSLKVIFLSMENKEHHILEAPKDLRLDCIVKKTFCSKGLEHERNKEEIGGYWIGNLE